MISIGLSGGLGSGKSLATRFFFELGANILNADDIAKSLIKVKPDLIAKIKEQFGEDCYLDGELQNSILAKRAFGSSDSLARLNAISHPALKEHLKKYIQAFKSVQGLLIIEAAVLFEAGFQDIFDKTLLIESDESVRLERAMLRGGLSEESIRKRMALQLSDNEKEILADYVIKNNGTEDDLRQKCLEFLEKLQIKGSE